MSISPTAGIGGAGLSGGTSIGGAGLSKGGGGPAPYVGPLDLVPGAVVTLDQYAPGAAYLGQPFATIDGVVYTYDESTGLNNGVAGAVSLYSGGPVALAQASAGNRPTFAASQFGDVPAFSFADADDSQLLSSDNVEISSGAVTSFVVCIPVTGATGVGMLWAIEDEPENTYCQNYLDQLQLRIETDFYVDPNEAGGRTGDAAYSEGAAYIIEMQWAHGSWSCKVNGVSKAQGSSYDSGGAVGPITQPVSIGNIVATGSGFNGKIGAVYVYPSLLSAGNCTTLRELFATRYGITLP